jgi:hypothetical protein
MKKLLKIVLVSSLSLLCFSCYYDEEVVIELPPVSEAKFAADIIPIIESYNCADCHNNSRDPDLRAGNEYDSLLDGFVTPFDADGSRFYTFLASGHRDVDATSLAKIELWINEGALNN